MTTPTTVNNIPPQSIGLISTWSFKRNALTKAVTDTAPPNTIGITNNALPLLIIIAEVKQSAPNAPKQPAKNPHFAGAKCCPLKLKLSPLTFIMIKPPMIAITR